MALRCLLFAADEGIAWPIRQVLEGLGIAAEYCPAAAGAMEKVSCEVWHLVIVDWDNQPEAGSLLQATRERRAAERPLTLAIVSQDANVPQALQAGANSVLKKPLLENQVRDTLTMARGLLRTKFETIASAAQAAAASASAGPGLPGASAEQKVLRAGEFLQAGGSRPSAQFETDSPKASFDQAAATEIKPVQELEPMAAAVEKSATRGSDEPRGLSSYLGARAGTLPPVPRPAQLPEKPDLLTYENTPLQSKPAQTEAESTAAAAAQATEHRQHHEHQAEAKLFAYITGESEKAPRESSGTPRPWIRKAILTGVLVLVCGIAYIKVPRSLWGQNLRILAANVIHAGNNWLKPQPVTPPQAAVTHETFGRAGDEYKLPVAENIPDATTDPSEIKVLPVIDPTVKQPNNAPNQPAAGSSASDQPSTTTAPVEEHATPQPTVVENPPASVPAQLTAPSTTSEPAHPDPFGAAPSAPSGSSSSAKSPQPTYTAATPGSGIPSSLKSQMATSTPEASGNKPVEAAMPSIEPVNLPEASARALLVQQPEPAYPATANGKQGTVVLQVLVGRDGAVQDAKFLQGSLVFARAAIDAVKQWHFKPYSLNGRPVSTQTVLTLTFKPAA